MPEWRGCSWMRWCGCRCRALRATVGGAPEYSSPVFLETRDAAAVPELDGELQRALHELARLIVLCSPLAVQSSYVAEEFRYFQSLGRGADILCLTPRACPMPPNSGSGAGTAGRGPYRPIAWRMARELAPAART